jgi:hypothetical protein
MIGDNKMKDSRGVRLLSKITIVLTHVLAQLGLCVHCVFAQYWMIAPNSSLQHRHAFALDKEPWFVSLLVYNRNEDSFNYVMLHNNSLSDE